MKDRRVRDIEVRANEQEDKLILEGYAVVFDEPATYYGETEIISPSAFDNCKMNDVVLRYNHNDDCFCMARTRNKSLELNVDEKGVYFKANLVNTTTNTDLYKMVKSGLVDKCSFAFADYQYKYEESTRTTTITDIGELFDVSIVDFPYYEGTNVEARSNELDTHNKLAQEIKEKRNARKKELKKELLKTML